MAIFLQSWRIWLCLAGCSIAIGCGSFDRTAAPPPAPSVAAPSPDLLRTGDTLTIEFTDIPSAPTPLVQTIREDGTIGLPLNLSVTAAGKTRGQLTDEIHDLYVPKYYRRMTVNLRTDNRFYYVGGDVKLPGKLIYVGDITVLKAIQSAGDFTDFGNRKNVLIIRANGQQEEVNVLKARKDPKRDVPIYPGDQVFVHRRKF